MQHEGHALGGTEPLEHDEQRHPDALVEHHQVGRVDGGAIPVDQRLRKPRARERFAADSRRPQMIEAQPGHHHHQPSANVIDHF